MDPGTLTRQTVRLDEWVAQCGPIWPASALVIVLDACASASRRDDRELGAVIGSLNTAGITRGRHGAWSWMPAMAGGTLGRVSDRDVIERLGAILFHALTGQAIDDPFADEQALRSRLRALRPELPAAVADLTVGALAVRRARGATLTAFARDVRQVLGVERQADRHTRRRTRLLGATLVLLAGLSAVSWMTVRGNQTRLEPHGLTRDETAVHEIATEVAAAYALANEHTAAIQLYQELQRVWSGRAPIDDPRLSWTRAHEAWVRLLTGDRFTARQLLEGLPDWLTRELGERHPYTRAVKLSLSHTIDPQGSDAEAASLRDEAERATSDLVRGVLRESDLLAEIPYAPGVVAHLAPNAPEREGFRRSTDGSFVAMLTSMQRLIAGRNGWRLHVVASGACRAWVVVGTAPRLVSLRAERAGDKTWRVIIEGTQPAVTLRRAGAGDVGVSLAADGSGSLTATLASETRALRIDATAPTPVPPYGLGFSGDGGAKGCHVVWLELPVPPRETVGAPPAPGASAVLVQHVERTDPRTEGFIDRGGMDAFGPVWNDLDGRSAWQITGRGCCSYFYHPVDDSALFTAGWRLTAIVRVGSGSGHVGIILDTGENHPRFDINLAAVGPDAEIRLPGSPLVYRVPKAAHRWLQLELRYDPESRRASLFVDGVQRLTGYAGWGWYRENRGVIFSTADVTANFSLVRLERGPF